ncbi:hypothetical protein BTA51_12790 [Hahella sp. CCB-MM4]|uniref:hypothetical protein n=1 Tax=Hahella sp. (strain CCB-MM4) TaxID=1926491 RepID=UPI000B9C54CA|nr:hypothetical protein [Hahella sp. CCB-MM4]OZG72847.1 hypothetical protein BTA51_12790 [Hahella sp. CCB-MM4]
MRCIIIKPGSYRRVKPILIKYRHTIGKGTEELTTLRNCRNKLVEEHLEIEESLVIYEKPVIKESLVIEKNLALFVEKIRRSYVSPDSN